jgi:hypothetical protein
MRLFVLASLVLIGVSVVAAPPNRKAKRFTLALPVGAEAKVIVIGDEVKRAPLLGRAGVVTPDSFVLIAEAEQDYQRSQVSEMRGKYRDAIYAMDPDGIRLLIERGSAFRVKAGTRVRVLEVRNVGPPPAQPARDLIQWDQQGLRLFRVINGELRGKVFELPARNLKPEGDDAAEEKPKAKR